MQSCRSFLKKNDDSEGIKKIRISDSPEIRVGGSVNQEIKKL
jgi:hypothetical protein